MKRCSKSLAIREMQMKKNMEIPLQTHKDGYYQQNGK